MLFVDAVSVMRCLERILQFFLKAFHASDHACRSARFDAILASHFSQPLVCQHDLVCSAYDRRKILKVHRLGGKLDGSLIYL